MAAHFAHATYTSPGVPASDFYFYSMIVGEKTSGTYDLILGSGQLALQIHESCGHPIELDRVLGMEANFTGTSFLTLEKLRTLRYGSPLINIVAGIYPPDEGTIAFKGQTVTLTPHSARERGINAVFQDFSLVPTLTVEENLFLGRELGAGGFLARRAMAAAATEAIATVHPTFSLKRRVDQLPRSAQQLVEIAKALMGDPDWTRKPLLQM